MRLQTKKGYEKSGVVKKPAAEQGNYVVQTGVKEYRRNRKHILAVSCSCFFTDSLSYSSSTASNPVKCYSPGSYHVKWGYIPWVCNSRQDTISARSLSDVTDKEVYQTQSFTTVFSWKRYAGGLWFKWSCILYCQKIASCHKIWVELHDLIWNPRSLWLNFANKGHI